MKSIHLTRFVSIIWMTVIDGRQLYLNHHDRKRPFHVFGQVDGKPEAEVLLHGNGQTVGRLVLGSRRGDTAYSRHELAALQSAADALGQAVVLAWDRPIRASDLTIVKANSPALTRT